MHISNCISRIVWFWALKRFNSWLLFWCLPRVPFFRTVFLFFGTVYLFEHCINRQVIFASILLNIQVHWRLMKYFQIRDCMHESDTPNYGIMREQTEMRYTCMGQVIRNSQCRFSNKIPIYTVLCVQIGYDLHNFIFSKKSYIFKTKIRY
jgi:hypothetical protein